MRYELKKGSTHIRYYSSGYTGWIADGKKKLVSPPADGWEHEDYTLDLVEDEAAPEPEPENPRLTGSFVAFMDLFTDEEQALILAAKANSVELELLLMRGTASNEIDLTSDLLINGINQLVQAGILSQERVDNILKAGF